MKLWFTDQGMKTLKSIAATCRREVYRLVVVVGRNDTRPLLDYLKKVCGSTVETEELANIDDLALIPITDTNRLIILHSLVSRSVEEPVEYLNRYCRQRRYELKFAPYAIRKSDIECLYQSELELGFGNYCDGNRWALDIAHETALALSAGILNCYYDIRENFIKAYEGDPEQLPDVQQCMDDYQFGQEREEDALLIKRRLRGNGGIERLLKNPDDDNWLVLWSVGLAGRYNGIWQFSPFLLDSPKMHRERQHRQQRAINSTLVPIYQAWVFYCERKYNLRELDDDRKLIPWYPKSVLEALEQAGIADSAELDMCRDVRGLRNWVQHDEPEERSYGPRDYRQTRISVLRTCAKVIRRIDPDGNSR